MEYQVPCQNDECDSILRLNISTNLIGHLIQITCPICRTEFRTVLVDREKIKQLLSDLGNAILEKIQSDEKKILRIMKQFVKMGLAVEINLVGKTIPLAGIVSDETTSEPSEMQVKFTNQDEKFLRALRITDPDSD